MNNQDLSFLDAIRIASEAEAKAVEFYAEAADNTENPLGRKLLNQLAEFEKHHHTQLVALEESLCDRGACIWYEGKKLDLQVPDEVEKIRDANKMSAVAIIDTAIEIKRKAEKRYALLAEQTSDPSGVDMFQKLALEERANRQILQEAYWSVNNRGVWIPSE